MQFTMNVSYSGFLYWDNGLKNNSVIPNCQCLCKHTIHWLSGENALSIVSSFFFSSETLSAQTCCISPADSPRSRDMLHPVSIPEFCSSTLLENSYLWDSREESRVGVEVVEVEVEEVVLVVEDFKRAISQTNETENVFERAKRVSRCRMIFHNQFYSEKICIVLTRRRLQEDAKSSLT